MCLRIHWDRIPARFPVHGGLHGRPNGWSSRTPAGVYGPLIFGAILVLFQMCLCVATHRGSRRRTQRSIALAIPTAAACVVAVAFSRVGLLPLYVVPMWTIMVLFAAFLLVVGAMILRAPALP